MKIYVLQIRNSGEDYSVFLCNTHAIAERIIREWFATYNNENAIEIHVQQETGRKIPTLEELEAYLSSLDIGYIELTQQEIIYE